MSWLARKHFDEKKQAFPVHGVGVSACLSAFPHEAYR